MARGRRGTGEGIVCGGIQGSRGAWSVWANLGEWGALGFRAGEDAQVIVRPRG